MTMPATACTPATRAALVPLSGTSPAVQDKSKQHQRHHIPADLVTRACFVAEGGEGNLARQFAGWGGSFRGQDA